MKFLVVIVLVAAVACRETVYMKKSGVEDQTSSASGYSYQVRSGAPFSYAGLTPAVSPNYFGYPPITLGRYTQELPLQLPLEATKYAAPQGLAAVPLNSYGVPVNPAATYGRPLHQSAPEFNKHSASSFSNGGGSDYGAAVQSSHGAKDSSGYKNLKNYEKGSQGHHKNEAEKIHYSNEGGNKAAHHESGEHYGNKKATAKGVQGESFNKASGRKKGSKTTGYHRVHHKDEYKKNHSFYDESDSKGHYHKYGDYDAKNAAEKGAFEKGEHENSGHKSGEYGSKGFAEKGKYLDDDSGYRGKFGKEAFYKDESKHGSEGGRQGEKEYGYREEEGARGHL